MNLANLYMQLKQYDEAVAHSRRAIELRPGLPKPTTTWAAVLTQEKYEEAIEACDKAAELKPNMPEATTTSASRWPSKDNSRRRRRYRQRSLALRSENPDALYNLGNAF